MSTDDHPRMEDITLSAVFAALAEPSRRKVVSDLLREEEGSVRTCWSFDLPVAKSTLTHHFAVLKQADLVRTERRGQYIVYSLNSTVMEDLARMVLDLFPAGAARGGKR